ncbi:hypothetical protein [Pseudoduganella sp. OTU4001]|uniref:hypothetical protein n=1 Tax=Pseudoduganella sp. OTU4001 TaxID=3043854 RepID=UPI00313CDC3A
MRSTTNPHIGDLERAPYHLGHLLVKLGRRDSTEDLKQISEAAETCASNARDALLRGLEAIGQVMAIASENQETFVEPRTTTSLGYLVSHIACELQFLGEVETVTYTAKVFADDAKQQGKSKDKGQTAVAQ